MKRVLVAGATGYLGRYVVKELKRQGFYIKALVRNPNKLNSAGPLFAPAIRKVVDEVVIGDVTKPTTLKNICENVDYVFTSVGLTRKSHGFTFEEVDYQGNAHLLTEAQHSQVEKFMYIHVCINDDWEQPNPLVEAKHRFVDLLTTSNVQHVIIRPTGYFSDVVPFFNMAKKGRVFLVGDGRTKMNPIHGEDLAKACVQSFAMGNRTIDVGGPEVLTYEQIARIAFEVLGTKTRITRLPVDLLTFASRGVKWFSKHHDGMIRFLMYVMTHHVVAPKYGKHKVKEMFEEML